MKTIFITSIFAGLALASGTLHPAEKRGVDIGNAFAQRWLEGKLNQSRNAATAMILHCALLAVTLAALLSARLRRQLL